MEQQEERRFVLLATLYDTFNERLLSLYEGQNKISRPEVSLFSLVLVSLCVSLVPNISTKVLNGDTTRLLVLAINHISEITSETKPTIHGATGNRARLYNPLILEYINRQDNKKWPAPIISPLLDQLVLGLNKEDVDWVGASTRELHILALIKAALEGVRTVYSEEIP